MISKLDGWYKNDKNLEFKTKLNLILDTKSHLYSQKLDKLKLRISTKLNLKLVKYKLEPALAQKEVFKFV